MHTFRKSNEGGGNYIWTVGYYTLEAHSDGVGSQSDWTPLEDFTDEKSAAAYVNYLNGGNAVVEVIIVEQ